MAAARTCSCTSVRSSGPGQELIENDIRDFNLTQVVVASCSPHMHEKTFRNACERAGLNGLNEGQKISYEVASERGREAAVNLKAVG